MYERPAERFAYLTLGTGIDPMREEVDDRDRTEAFAFKQHTYWRGMNLSIDVGDVTALHAALLSAGHDVQHLVEDRWFARTDDEIGVREFTVVDPDGYVLRPTQHIGTRSPGSAARIGDI